MLPYSHIEAYAHDTRIGVLVELSASDDYTTRCAEFRQLARDLALQVTAMSPQCVDASSLDYGAHGRALVDIGESLASLPPTERLARISSLRQEYERRHCLMAQPFIKEPTRSVGEVVAQVAAQLKSEVRVVRFVRYAANGV